jgi:hypothetical protein
MGMPEQQRKEQSTMATHMPKEPGVYQVPEQMEEAKPPLAKLTAEERRNLPWPLTLQEWRDWELQNHTP